MKARIKTENEIYEIEGEFLNEVKPETTYFLVPKDNVDTMGMIEAVKCGALNGMSDINGTKWLISVRTDKIEWCDE